MINAAQLRYQVIRPVLKKLVTLRTEMADPAAENLLLGTAACMSASGTFTRKPPAGATYGLLGITLPQHSQVIEWASHQGHEFRDLYGKIWAQGLTAQENLMWNMAYNVMVGRLLYYKAGIALPSADNYAALAEIWMAVYPGVKPGQLSRFTSALTTAH